MKEWSWKRSVNPLEDEVTAESIAWLSQFPYFTHRGWDYTDILLKSGSSTEGIKCPLSLLIDTDRSFRCPDIFHSVKRLVTREA